MAMKMKLWVIDSYDTGRCLIRVIRYSLCGLFMLLFMILRCYYVVVKILIYPMSARYMYQLTAMALSLATSSNFILRDSRKSRLVNISCIKRLTGLLFRGAVGEKGEL